MTMIHPSNLNLNGHKSFGLILTAALMLALCSCGQGAGSVSVVHQNERNNIEEATLVSIDDSLPMLHDASFLEILGDTLIIEDHKSTDWIFHAFDIAKGQYIGSFGPFGGGPSELSNVGGVFINNAEKELYCINGGRNRIVKFDLDKAIPDTTYRPVDVIEMATISDGALRIPYHFNYINDTLLICTVATHHPETRKLETYLGSFNLLTGESSIKDDLTKPTIGRSNHMAVSVSDDLIVVASHDQDYIRFYDLSEKLQRAVTGPNYSEKPVKGIEHFYNVRVAGDKLCAVYLNRPLIGDDKRSDIIIMDLKGNYLKTYRMNDHIWDMVYNESTGRLYVSCDGDPQFGYIQID